MRYLFKKWHKEYNKCVECYKSDKRHIARGLCSRCYAKWMYHNSTNRKKSLRKSLEKWKDKNPDKYKEIQSRAVKKYYYKKKYEKQIQEISNNR